MASRRTRSPTVSDCQSKLIITADEGLRGGRRIPLKANVDAALKLPGTNTVETVLVVRHTGGAVDMQAPRDRWFHDVVDSQPSTCEPERMNAEDPLFILYTSGSTGRRVCSHHRRLPAVRGLHP